MLKKVSYFITDFDLSKGGGEGHSGNKMVKMIYDVIVFRDLYHLQGLRAAGMVKHTCRYCLAVKNMSV